MHDINHALGVIREILRLPDLELNGDGQAEIDFGDGLSIYVTRVEEAVAEWSFRLPDLAAADPSMMRAMLEANCLGTGTGAGRLGLEGDGAGAIYCERWDVRDLDAAAVERRFSALVAYGTYWKTEGTDLVLAQAEKHRSADTALPVPSADDEPEMVLRV